MAAPRSGLAPGVLPRRHGGHRVMHGGGSEKNGGVGGPSAPDAISSRQPSGCRGHLWPSSQGEMAPQDTGLSPMTRNGGQWHLVQPEGCHGEMVPGALGPPAPPFSVKPPPPPCLRVESTGASPRRDAESSARCSWGRTHLTHLGRVSRETAGVPRRAERPPCEPLPFSLPLASAAMFPRPTLPAGPARSASSLRRL
jgi:hypothetical protein